MKVLFITSRLPYPIRRGDNVRAYHFLRILSRRHKITLVAPMTRAVSAFDIDELRRFCQQLILVPFRKCDAVLNMMRFPFCQMPLQVLYFCPPAFEESVRKLIYREKFDIIHVHLARMAPAVVSIKNTPKVIDFTDALSMNMSRRANLEPWPLSFLFRLEGRLMSRYEGKILRLSSHQVVTTAMDKAAIGDSETLHIVPNGISFEDFHYNENGREPRCILFHGRMGYFPNTKAAIYFAKQVFPLIRKEEPSARFFIVGSDPPRAVRRLGDIEGIIVTGEVPRIQDYLYRAEIVVAPMQAGTGIQNKILEAMACGAPVVATPFALGGIKAIDEEHVLVGKSPQELAEKVIRLFKDMRLRLYLARNARQLVEKHYTWESSVKQLENVYYLAIQASNDDNK